MCFDIEKHGLSVIRFATLFFNINLKYSAVETKSLHLLVFEIHALFHCKIYEIQN